MVSSGGCLWNQNASLVCSSETHYCDLKKKNTFNLEGQKATVPGVPTWLRKMPHEVNAAFWISNTSIDLSVDGLCCWSCLSSKPHLVPWGRGPITRVQLWSLMEEEGQRGPAPCWGKDPNALFQQTDILQIKVSLLAPPSALCIVNTLLGRLRALKDAPLKSLFTPPPGVGYVDEWLVLFPSCMWDPVHTGVSGSLKIHFRILLCLLGARVIGWWIIKEFNTCLLSVYHVSEA